MRNSSRNLNVINQNVFFNLNIDKTKLMLNKNIHIFENYKPRDFQKCAWSYETDQIEQKKTYSEYINF